MIMHLDYETLADWLNKQKMNTEIVPLNATLSYLKAGYRDLEDQERTFYIHLIPADLIALSYDTHKKFSSFEVVYVYPFKPLPTALSDTLLLLAHLNITSLFPGFGYSGLESQIIYRYSMPINNQFSHSMFTSVIQTITDLIEIYEIKIQSVASGEISYQQLVDEATDQVLHNLPLLQGIIENQ